MKLEDPLPSQLHMTTAFAWILTVSLHPAYTCIGCKEAKQFRLWKCVLSLWTTRSDCRSYDLSNRYVKHFK
ncbi:unnamed protein product [Ixodes persulcatus]